MSTLPSWPTANYKSNSNSGNNSNSSQQCALPPPPSSRRNAKNKDNHWHGAAPSARRDPSGRASPQEAALVHGHLDGRPLVTENRNHLHHSSKKEKRDRTPPVRRHVSATNLKEKTTALIHPSTHPSINKQEQERAIGRVSGEARRSVFSANGNIDDNRWSQYSTKTSQSQSTPKLTSTSGSTSAATLHMWPGLPPPAQCRREKRTL